MASAAIIAEWNFNANPGPTSASTGSGEVTGAFIPIGGGFGPPTGVNVGSPADPNPVLVGGVLNNSVAGRSGPNSGEASGAAGIRNLTATASTAGYKDITISFHALQGYRASRFHQILATADGTTFNMLPNGIGSSATTLGSPTLAPNGVAQTSQSATVSPQGLVTIITNDNMIPDPATGDAFIHELSYTFPSGSIYENNANFAFLIGAVPDVAAGDYVSSYAGTTEAADAVKGYIRNTSAGGNSTLYDMITISGTAIPEPNGMLPILAGGFVLLAVGRRKRSRC